MKRLSGILNEGWASDSIRRSVGERRRKEEYTVCPKTKKELQKIISDRTLYGDYTCDLNDIDVSLITDMSNLLDVYDENTHIPVGFNGDMSRWDVSGVTNMKSMFNGCKYFNGDLSRWDVSGVDDMSGMFNGCEEFNGDIDGWKVSGVRNMGFMFNGCSSFNRNIGRWDVSNVENMEFMFSNCTSFNGDIREWNVSSVNNMDHMFNECTVFNRDIGGWKVLKVKNIHSMFFYCEGFTYGSSLDGWIDLFNETPNMVSAFKGCESCPSWYKE